MSAYSTNMPRAILGLLAGVLTGATLVTLWSFVGSTGADLNAAGQAIFIFVVAAAVWAGGLTLVASVPWICLDHYGLRGWTVAVALGAALTFLVVIAFLTNVFGMYDGSGNFSAADNDGPTWIDGRLTPHGWANALYLAAICGGMGGVVGLAVWRTAYRRMHG